MTNQLAKAGPPWVVSAGSDSPQGNVPTLACSANLESKLDLPPQVRFRAAPNSREVLFDSRMQIRRQLTLDCVARIHRKSRMDVTPM
ncbi:MAG: hypothetical protein NTY15_07375 [Planctomycetota bacterium]|nr:hypothetical protein [Planctomycetota bacterium]